MTRFPFRFGASLLPITLLAAPAFAQTAPAQTDSAQQGVPDASAAANDPQTQGAPEGDIVVTAQRTSSLASKTPVALSAIDGTALRTQGITNPTRLGDQVPNLSIVRNNGLQITIRGVTSSDNTEKGDPSAAFLLDGIYIARPQVQEVSFFDIARVEVLRGPQGTLYGKNTTAGVVNVITNRPVDRFEAAGNVAYGNYDAVQADAMVNVPVADWLALRVAGSYDRRDNYLTPRAGDTHSLNPFKNNLSGRAQALFTISPDITFLLRGDYSKIKGNSFSSLLGGNLYYAPLPAGVPSYSNPQYIADRFTNDQKLTLNYGLVNNPSQDSNTWGVDGELNWNLGGFALTYLGSYRDFHLDQTSTAYLGISYATHFYGDFKQTSHELRLATSGTGPLKAQAGGYYFHETSNDTLALLNLLPAYPYYAFAQGPTTTNTYGIFGQATYSILPRLRLTGGVRYSHDDKKRIGDVLQQKTTTFNAATDIDQTNNAEIASSRITWRAGVDYDLDSRSLLYGVVSTGYKAGGFNDGCLATTPGCTNIRTADTLFYAPETLTSYEIGLKTRLLDNMLRFAGSAFLYDYDNLQVTATRNVGGVPRQYTQNAARAKIKGVELEWTLTPSPRNRVDAAFTYLDAHYTSYFPLGLTAAPDYAGRPLDRSPKVTVAAGYTYTLPLGASSLSFAARTRLSSRYVLTAQAVARQYRQPSYTQTDVTLTYNAPGDRYYLQGFARNLENTIIVTALGVSNGILSVTPGDPRTYGVRAGFRF